MGVSAHLFEHPEDDLCAGFEVAPNLAGAGLVAPLAPLEVPPKGDSLGTRLAGWPRQSTAKWPTGIPGIPLPNALETPFQPGRVIPLPDWL